MKPSTISPTRLFDEICKQGDPLYFRNALQKSKGIMGDIIIGVQDPSSRRGDTLRIPKNCVICVNEQTTLEAVKTNADIRLYIRKGYLEVLDQTMFEEECAKNPNILTKAGKELNRMTQTEEYDENAPHRETAEERAAQAPSYIRPVVAQLFSKAQFGDEEESIILDDFKACEPYTQVEIAHMQGNLATVDENYLRVRKYVMGL